MLCEAIGGNFHGSFDFTTSLCPKPSQCFCFQKHQAPGVSQVSVSAAQPPLATFPKWCLAIEKESLPAQRRLTQPAFVDARAGRVSLFQMEADTCLLHQNIPTSAGWWEQKVHMPKPVRTFKTPPSSRGEGPHAVSFC